MRKLCLVVLALAGVLTSSPAQAAIIAQDFATDPLQGGWQVFGNTNLFHWNSTNQNLEVTWDSTQPNSYFYHPLGTVLARSDDFGIEFDLLLTDIASGTEPGKTGGLELGIGLLNLATATSTNFMRGVYGGAPNLAEFDYFPAGYYDFGGTIWDMLATATPTFISTDGVHYAPTVFAPYAFELPTNLVVHVMMSYTASNQTLVTLLTTNGVPLIQLPNAVITDTNTSGFTDAEDFRVDAFSISSYSSAGDDSDSILAHGMVDNLTITFPQPIQSFTGSLTNGTWQGQFSSRSNWLYTLERTADLQNWTNVSLVIPGNGASLFLEDPSPSPDRAFYRIRATRP